MKNKLLIICDSHGTMWGAKGYAYQLRLMLSAWQVDIIEFPGLSLEKIIKKVEENNIDTTNYQALLIGLGNPDIHPRMPRYIMGTLRRFGLRFIRDSYFSIPPQVSLSYFFRLPFFLFRLIIIRAKYESYTNAEEYLDIFNTLIERLKVSSECHLIILPIFLVKSLVYGPMHNIAANSINSKLSNTFPRKFFVGKCTEPKFYQAYYNQDFFHLQTTFHFLLAKELSTRLQGKDFM